MNIAILSIGDELLRGIIDNKNASYIANQLFINGFQTKTILSVADDINDIVNALDELSKLHDMIITTGGLGPTPDDKTIEAIAEWLNVPIVLNDEVKKTIQNFYENQEVKYTKMRERMAMLPQSAELLPNPVGAAPGVKVKKDNVFLFSLPGVPQEAQTIFDQSVLPWIINNYSAYIWRVAYTFRNTRESEIAAVIEPMIEKFDTLSAAYLPSYGYLRIVFTAKKDYSQNVDFKKFISSLIYTFREFFVYDDIDKPEVYLHKLLVNSKKTLCTLESCTGGTVASKIVSNAGSSEYYKGTLVCYSNEIKEEILDVPEEILAKKGAVSKETVRYMAVNGKELFD
ncbi:MAG TPA: nicotinamide-nucleotide amidohydrolase family protein, partial [Bacteroidales bacterium]|nr:nicotinamide-nucleotide amidohydrolase family protein [Bacteroidales bacterium]